MKTGRAGWVKALIRSMSTGRLPVNHYRRGAALEYAVRDHLADAGYEVVRSAGSHGAADVIGFKPGETVFVQCKRDGRCGPAERVELLRLAGLVGGVAVVASRPHRRPIRYRELVGPAARDHRPWSPDFTG